MQQTQFCPATATPEAVVKLTLTSQSKSVDFDVAAHQLKEIHARSALTTVPYHDVLQLAPVLTLVSGKDTIQHNQTGQSER
ncbi:hypothetical protein DPMN_079007 [Dreissena polymorpha]|uniref:Uncharacterized protein n=1 Tax=Dreissena polymorpha TaxID=45954 RepID=A0A9D3YSA0_DREPO|nr:hypothetical protein DPMN_079007 [Dreissena polymorpha]